MKEKRFTGIVVAICLFIIIFPKMNVQASDTTTLLRNFATSKTYLGSNGTTYHGYLYKTYLDDRIGFHFDYYLESIPIIPISYRIDDYDQDGTYELLIVSFDNEYNAILEMYEVENGIVVLKSSTKLNRMVNYDNYEYLDWTAGISLELDRGKFNCFTYSYNGKKMIGVEESGLNFICADGANIYFGMVNYDGAKLNILDNIWYSGSDYYDDFPDKMTQEFMNLGITLNANNILSLEHMPSEYIKDKVIFASVSHDTPNVHDLYSSSKYEGRIDNVSNIIFSMMNLENVEEAKYQKSIAVFTTEKSMRIKTGKSMCMGFGLLDKNSDLLDDKWKKMSVVVSDPTVIALSDYTETEYGYSLEVIGKKQGSTNITITDTESGINTIITVFVQDDYTNTYSYAIDNMKSFYPNNEFEKNMETNIYDLNGLYVNKYKCTKSTDSYNVSFDVYNSKYYSGAVDIYDENGMWLGYEEIDKYSDISSLSDTLEQAYFLVSDTVTGKMLTYEQASFSKHTHIDIKVPKDGYFTISNNVSESPGTFFVNAFEILFDGVSTAFDLFTSDSIEDSALTQFQKEAKKTFATRLIEARNEGLKDNIKKNSQKVMLDSLKSEIKKITEKFTKKGLKNKLQSIDDEYSEMANLAENMLNSFDIEWKHLFESATGIVESYFTTFAGPAGIALKGCFALNDTGNKALMAKEMTQSTEKPYVTIFSSIDTGYINPYGIIVNTNGNVDKKSILQVFRVSNSDVIEILLDSDNPFENYELYNICFVKDDKLVQPNGKVTVQIPIPKGMKGNTCKVYRQESDGAWTIINAKVQGNYLVFETEHFSLYAVIGENDDLVISSLPKKINYEDGEILDTYGLVLDLNGQLITEGYICEPTVLSGNGKQFVKVIYGHSVTEFEVNIERIETPTNTPQIKPTPMATVTPTVATSSGLGIILGGGVSIVYTPSPTTTPVATPTVVSVQTPTPVPVTTPTPIVTPVPISTPTPTIIPTIKPEVSAAPSVMPSPSSSPDTETDNKTGSEKNIKKGLKFTDKKTKAVYKITSTGKNKSVQYVKSTKKNITNATVPASVQFNGKTFKVVSIGKGAFKNNKKLKSVKIGKNVKTIGKEAFSGCKKLGNVKMGKNITSIKASAFNKCTSLIKITIPAKVKKIGEKAFYKCKNLHYILVKTKTLKTNNVGKEAFGNGYANPRVKSDKTVWRLYQDIFTSNGLSNRAVFIINPVKLVI